MAFAVFFSPHLVCVTVLIWSALFPGGGNPLCRTDDHSRASIPFLWLTPLRNSGFFVHHGTAKRVREREVWGKGQRCDSVMSFSWRSLCVCLWICQSFRNPLAQWVLFVNESSQSKLNCLESLLFHTLGDTVW